MHRMQVLLMSLISGHDYGCQAQGRKCREKREREREGHRVILSHWVAMDHMHLLEACSKHWLVWEAAMRCRCPYLGTGFLGGSQTRLSGVGELFPSEGVYQKPWQQKRVAEITVLQAMKEKGRELMHCIAMHLRSTPV